MQIYQTWDSTQTWDPANPAQQTVQYYSPADMGYQSAYWNEVPTTAQNLMGILPTSNYARAGIAAGLAVAVFFVVRHAKKAGLLKGVTLLGAGKRRRRRRK